MAKSSTVIMGLTRDPATTAAVIAPNVALAGWERPMLGTWSSCGRWMPASVITCTPVEAMETTVLFLRKACRPSSAMLESFRLIFEVVSSALMESRRMSDMF